jgi:carboxymethylenebutenolidase
MKNIILLTLTLFISMNLIYSQTKHPCCDEMTGEQSGQTPTEKFAAFGSDAGFIAEHPDPLPANFTDLRGKMITFKTKDGTDGNGYEVKSDKPGSKFIFMFHEWYGLNDYIKSEADALQNDLPDVTVIAVDLYDGKVASTSEEAGKYVQSVKTDRAINIINGVIEYSNSNTVGTIGWCFGGGWSLQSAILLGDKCKVCVMYYGMPETDKDKLSKLQAPVLGIFALKDTHITPQIVSQFESDMTALGKSIQIKNYDAVHAFANPSNPQHDPDATKDARALTLKFFQDNLK